MQDLLLHPKTKIAAESIIAKPPHGLLISGKSGSNKTKLAEFIASSLLGVDVESISKHPYVLIIDPPENFISIEETRSMQNFLKLKVPEAKKSTVNRIILIKQAERMRSDAQNTLLKTLEEPPAGTVMILTSDKPTSLLPTILSRLHTFEVLPVPADDAFEFLSKSGLSKTDFDKAYAMSGGQAGLLEALVNDAKHPLIDNIVTAKQILSEPITDRLLRVDELAKDKNAINELLAALLRIAHAGLFGSAKKGNGRAANEWLRRYQLILESAEYMSYNAQAKLILDNLFINL